MLAGESVLFILKGYPRLSETFIAQEIRSLEENGLRLRIASLRHPTDKKRHPVHDEIKAPVSYLPEYLYQEIPRVWRAWREVRQWPGYARTFRAFLRDLRRDPTPNRGRRFGQAMVLAAELPADVVWLHAHFMHTPTSVARYGSMLTGLGFSCSVHAKDLWTQSAWEISEKLIDARWIVTCTASGAHYLRSLAAEPEKVHLSYHGLDLERFPVSGRAPAARDGRERSRPAVILSVGRIVPKKGYDLLIRALAKLPPDLHWRFVHVGGGDKRALQRHAEAADIAELIEWRGAQAQQSVLDAYRNADLFVLPSRIAADGDRDGLPNVLMEAQSQGLACLSTDISGIPELIVNGETGMLIPPDDVDALTEALITLITDPGLRERLGAAGEQRVRKTFDHSQSIGQLQGLFAEVMPRSEGPSLERSA